MPLGAGKTRFAKGFAAGLGVTEEVTSPSFTLMAEYRGRLALFHQDLYRLAGAAEALDGGLLDERQDAGVTLTEWADRLDAPVDQDRLDVRIVVDEGTPEGVDLDAEGDRVLRMAGSSRVHARYLERALAWRADPDVSWRLVIDTATRRTVIAVGVGRVAQASVVLDTRDHHGVACCPTWNSVGWQRPASAWRTWALSGSAPDRAASRVFGSAWPRPRRSPPSGVCPWSGWPRTRHSVWPPGSRPRR